MDRYDAIVIGGGHNGLVAGAYLAKAGARTVVLEARHKTGGAAATDQPWPDAPEYRVTTLSYVMSLMPDTILSDLAARRGTATASIPSGPTSCRSPTGDASCRPTTTPRRTTRSSRSSRRRTPTRSSAWDAWIGGLADVLGPMLMSIPPTVGSKRPADLMEQLRLAWRFRGLDVKTIGDVTRLMTM